MKAFPVKLSSKFRGSLSLVLNQCVQKDIKSAIVCLQIVFIFSCILDDEKKHISIGNKFRVRDNSKHFSRAQRFAHPTYGK